jgi:hypothetical protein
MMSPDRRPHGSRKQQRLDHDRDNTGRRHQLADVNEIELLKLHAVNRYERTRQAELAVQ